MRTTLPGSGRCPLISFFSQTPSTASRISRAWQVRLETALKPSGRFAIVNWHARAREETIVLGEPRGPRTELRMSPEQTIKVAEIDDLKFRELIDVPPYHY